MDLEIAGAVEGVFVLVESGLGKTALQILNYDMSGAFNGIRYFVISVHGN